MDKKDLIFLATTIVVADRFAKFAPEPEQENKAPKEFFSRWYQFLASMYEECL